VSGDAGGRRGPLPHNISSVSSLASCRSSGGRAVAGVGVHWGKDRGQGNGPARRDLRAGMGVQCIRERRR
jgi:hypothetical protein